MVDYFVGVLSSMVSFDQAMARVGEAGRRCGLRFPHGVVSPIVDVVGGRQMEECVQGEAPSNWRSLLSPQSSAEV